MVTRYALVCGGVVDNVALWDGETDWTPPDDCDLIRLTDDQAVSPGDTYDGGSTFAPATTEPPPALIPVEVDPAAVAAAIDAGNRATNVAGLRAAFVALAEQMLPFENV